MQFPEHHRHDFMGFTKRVPWLKTPNLDRLAAEGAHFSNAFVSTAAEHQSRIKGLATELYDWLETTGGMQVPLKRTVKHRFGDYKNQHVY